MHRLDDLFTLLDVNRDPEYPRFPLERRRLSLSGILVEGYQVTTTIRGVPFRFTAVLCSRYSACGLGWDTPDAWTLERLQTLDRALVTELFRQFIGFASSVIEAEPVIHDFGFLADPGDPWRMRFYTTATEILATRWHATSVIKALRYNTEFRITLPEHP